MTPRRSVAFAGETFSRLATDTWASHTKTFRVFKGSDGSWCADSTPEIEIDGLYSHVSGYPTEEDALRSAIIRLYEIHIRYHETNLSKFKETLREALEENTCQSEQ